jgi:hypothetical protein
MNSAWTGLRTKILLTFCLLFLTAQGYSQTATVTGTIQDPTPQVFAGGTVTINFVPNPSFNGPYKINGGPLQLNGANYVGPVTLVMDGTGTFSTTMSRNDVIAPAGSLWQFIVCPNASSTCTTANIPIAAANVNISVTMNAFVPAISVPASITFPHAYSNSEIQLTPVPGQSYWNVTSNTLNIWNGATWLQALLSGSTPTFSSLIVTGNTTTASLTVTGNETVGGTLGVTGITTLGSVLGKSYNSVQECDQFAGATADVKVAAALAALPSSGGTADCRGFGLSTQQWAATVTVNAHQTLLFDPATNFQASAAGINFFIFEPSAVIRGFTFDCSTQASYSGIVFQNDTTKFYRDPDGTEISDINIQKVIGGPATCGNAAGRGLKLNSTGSSLGVAGVTFRHWRQWGLLDGVLITSSAGTGTGFVNGNHFIDWFVTNATTGAHITGGGAQIIGNVFTPFSCEADASGVNCVLFDGTCAGSDNHTANQFYGDMWDYTTSAVFTTTCDAHNLLVGRMDGAISDPSLLNDWINMISGSQTMTFHSVPIVSNNGITNNGGITGTGTIATTNAANPAINAVNGSIHAGGVLRTDSGFQIFNNTVISASAPTIAAGGCGGTVATLSAPSGTGAFTIFTGTAPTTACTITMPTATTGWVCGANTVSANSTTNFIIKQTGAVSTTSVVLTLFSDVAVATNYQASDTLRVNCMSY